MGLFQAIFPARAKQEADAAEERKIAILKATLGIQKDQQELETGRKATTPIEMLFGTRPTPNATAGAEMAGETVTAAPQEPALPVGMEGMGKFNMNQAKDLADIRYKLGGGATGRQKAASPQDVTNSGGLLKEGEIYTQAEIAQATAMGRALTLQGNAKTLQGEELLTPDEALKLGVKYGTKRKDAIGKEPQKIATDAQSITATYANRLEDAEETLSGLADYAKTVNPLLFLAQKNAPDYLNALKNPKFRQLEQAMSNYINATLRRESGAVINPDEFAKGFKQYFTVPGDDDKTIAQKKRNREIVTRGFVKGAGAAYSPNPKIEDPSKPVQVNSEAEAEALPNGARFILNGKTGTVHK